MNYDSVVKFLNDWSSIWNNTLSFFVLLFWLIGWILYISKQKHKIIILSSNRINIVTEDDELKKAIFPIPSYEEAIRFHYDNSISPKDFINNNKLKLIEIKEKYQYICIGWVSDMFIPFILWYLMQNTRDIIWLRRLKLKKVFWNPWAYPWFFSLKWLLWIKNKFFSQKMKELNEIDMRNWDDINLILPFSFKIHKENIPSNLSKNKEFIFWLEKINGNFLINEWQLRQFQEKIEKVIQRINKEIWTSWKIHIFGTLPMPFCIALWQAIHRNDCECIFYDLNRETSKYEPIISTKDIDF